MPADLTEGMDHDFYAWSGIDSRPKLTWPDGKPLAFAVLVDVSTVTAAELAHDSDAHATHVTVLGGLDDRGHRSVDARGVQRVVPADHVVEQRRVEDRAGAGTGLVEAGGERDEAVAGDPAVGRLDADGAGDRRGLADRAPRVGADRQRRLEGRHRRCGPAA